LEFCELLGFRDDRILHLIRWLQMSEKTRSLRRIDLSLNFLQKAEIEALLKVLPNLCPVLEVLNLSHNDGEWKDRRAIQRCFGDLLSRPAFRFLVIVGSDLSHMSDVLCKLPRYQKIIFSGFWKSKMFGSAPPAKYDELMESHRAYHDYLEGVMGI